MFWQATALIPTRLGVVSFPPPPAFGRGSAVNTLFYCSFADGQVLQGKPQYRDPPVRESPLVRGALFHARRMCHGAPGSTGDGT